MTSATLSDVRYICMLAYGRFEAGKRIYAALSFERMEVEMGIYAILLSAHHLLL